MFTDKLGGGVEVEVDGGDQRFIRSCAAFVGNY